ncbi:hypothetical protein C8D92_101402 [Tamilnaduibacter salinus]|uniref:Uncharacterized protein n=1 Tax=Tamilnaduibacter salinus TaxID=1484056 RepID=A0A2A2HZM5_9GAMM|nr:hypothetical protein CF392_16190 [Tamilnaduibacter salinus]PVY79193.1 hypothetical protein C8D92_101402 [Tamilnaduibacter salinus]
MVLFFGSGVAISPDGPDGGMETLFYVVALASFVGWLCTLHIDGWLGTPPGQLREHLRMINERLEGSGSSINEEQRRNLQKRKEELQKKLAQARVAGFTE